MFSATPWDHALAVLCGLVLPVVGVLQRPRRADDSEPETFDSREKIVVYWGNSALLWILAGAVVVAWRHGDRTVAELGLTAPLERPAHGLLLALVFLGAYSLDTWRQLATPKRLADTRARWRRDTPFMPETPRELRHSLVLVASASVCEEVAFRGFLVAYVTSFVGTSAAGLTFAVALPALVFAVCHAYQGFHAMAKIALLAGIFGAILVVTGSLWIPIALHVLVDLVGVLLGPTLLRPGEAPPTSGDGTGS